MAETPNDCLHAAGGTLRDAKRAMRERVLRERDAMPAVARAVASRAIVAALLEREDFGCATTLLFTLPFGSEWDTRPLLDAALVRGKRVVLPRVDATSRSLDLCVVGDLGRDIAPGYRGIPEPVLHCDRVAVATIDWVLVPGVAFDSKGRRIGYGGGYYDRLLARLRSDARRISGAFALQIVERVPAAAHDLAVDAVVTEFRLLVIDR